MQHKHSKAPLMIKLGAGLAVVVVAVVLMTAHIAAPQHAIEKELDAKAFLEQK